MDIYKKAKKVFTGKIFDVYQWKQKMYDGSYETFEMLKRPYTVQVIATANNKILLSEESQPTKGKYLGLFGGRIDKGETPLNAAKRELLEESGYVSDKWEFFKVYDPLQKMDWKLYYYIAKDCKKVAKQNLDSGERIKIVNVDFDKFIKLAGDEKFRGGNFSADILRLKLDNKKLEKFRKRIF